MNDELIQKGWECPKCGRVYSPSTLMCYYCGNEKTFATTDLSFMLNIPAGFNLLEGEKNDTNKIKCYNLYANALLSDGKILFWWTGRDKCKSVYDFYKDFYYADIDVEEYEKEHNLSLVYKEFEVYTDNDNEKIFNIDSVEFYRQYELSPDFKGEKPYN